MLDVFLDASKYPYEFFICILAAFLPVLIWIFIFMNKSEKDFFHLIITFIMGMGSAGLILLYQYFWGNGPINLLFFGVEAYDFKLNIINLLEGPLLIAFATYLSVGFLEETLKHFVVVKADTRIFSSIDEVIELSIIAALGFAFLENIAYFYMQYMNGGMNSNFWIFVLQRSLFVVFVHVLCSAIYGYFYGIGFFAKPYMQYQISHGKRFPIVNFFHRVLHFKKASFFREKMMITGLIMASVLHGLYNVSMHINPIIYTSGDYILRLDSILLPTMLIGGFGYLSYLLNKKSNMYEFGEREIEYVYKRPSYEIGKNSRNVEWRE
jgi:RsiW-degrading membrane proteinase PrsW (M82 family)